mmetsp:Transcript_13994/g.44819  ORF Transcript_13994/g.44819 Transcript_13994/m.44819 type:complete len:454 (-) Transcript_13994:1545-2906(-)
MRRRAVQRRPNLLCGDLVLHKLERAVKRLAFPRGKNFLDALCCVEEGAHFPENCGSALGEDLGRQLLLGEQLAELFAKVLDKGQLNHADEEKLAFRRWHCLRPLCHRGENGDDVITALGGNEARCGWLARAGVVGEEADSGREHTPSRRLVQLRAHFEPGELQVRVHPAHEARLVGEKEVHGTRPAAHSLCAVPVEVRHGLVERKCLIHGVAHQCVRLCERRPNRLVVLVQAADESAHEQRENVNERAWVRLSHSLLNNGLHAVHQQVAVVLHGLRHKAVEPVGLVDAVRRARAAKVVPKALEQGLGQALDGPEPSHHLARVGNEMRMAVIDKLVAELEGHELADGRLEPGAGLRAKVQGRVVHGDGPVQLDQRLPKLIFTGFAQGLLSAANLLQQAVADAQLEPPRALGEEAILVVRLAEREEIVAGRLARGLGARELQGAAAVRLRVGDLA